MSNLSMMAWRHADRFHSSFHRQVHHGSEKTKWVREFNQLKQGKDTIEEYVDDFMRLLQKVDLINAWTNEMKV